MYELSRFLREFDPMRRFGIVANPSRQGISSRPSSSNHSDPDTVRRVLESCRLPTDFRNAAASHGKIIKAGSCSHPSDVARQILAYVRCRRIDCVQGTVRVISTWPDSILTINLVMRSLMGSGEYTAAQKMFDKLPGRDVVTWNTMIGGLVKNGKFEEAICKFRDMMGEKAEPDGFTFVSVFTACGRIGVSSQALWVHKLMIEKRIKVNFILNAALIDMYSRCGKIQIAREVFYHVPREDVSVWNAMINGLATHGLGQDAITLFSRMEAENVWPDAITFVSVLTACGCCGLVDDGRQYFHMMRGRYSIEPELEHYGAMVHLLARAGLLDEAYAMVNAMPMEPDSVIWRVLLSSSRLFQRPELGEVAIQNIRDHQSGDYVMLSNTYCSLTRWDSAERLRNLMKRKGIRKNCGRSWIEMGGVVHHFTAGDMSHPETKAIYRELEELVRRTSSEGFTRATNLVIMDVSEEEKEGNLNVHSEKLAVAYGVLKSNPGSEIMVLKNLRICYDCHCWIKLVSKLLRRVIIVRDRVRFHLFEGGSCSCGDYW